MQQTNDTESNAAITAIRHVTSAALHNVNNLLSPMLLSVSKVEMFLETGRIEQLKTEMPKIISNVENHVTAITETLRFLNDIVMSDIPKMAQWRDVDVKIELKKKIDPLINK
ncbi:MAG TPA: hypothetical protein PKK26_11225 [Candidatus Wallbacteria bacterium]|nr:hypothetical protein [Candidatus Wallbacteria bacterium]